MDLVTVGVWVACVLGSGAILLAISMLGMKEKTYEEALAEQRQKPPNTLLIKPKPKPKPKTKAKPKQQQQQRQQAAKRSDSQAGDSGGSAHDSHDTEPDSGSEQPAQPQLHVKIVAEAEVLPLQGAPPTTHPTHNKKKKVKPILVKREVEVEVAAPTAAAAASAPAAASVQPNHFHITQPKDDLSLKKAAQVTNGLKQADVASSPAAAEPVVVEAEVKQTSAVQTSKNASSASGSGSASGSATPADTSSRSSPVPAKLKKKKKSGDSSGVGDGAVTVQQLTGLVARAELSPYERQLLTDLLLSGHPDGRQDLAEWSEAAQMAKLKKQLADKELQLSNELVSAQGVQIKLKELRSELNEERGKSRQYEEAMVGKMQEMQALQQRMHQTTRDRQALVQELHQVQNKMKDDALVMRSLQEAGQQKAALQQEKHAMVQQMQQLDAMLQRATEGEAATKAQLLQLTQSYNVELQGKHRADQDLLAATHDRDALQQSLQALQQLPHQLQESEANKRELEGRVSELMTSQDAADTRLREALAREDTLQQEKLHLTHQLSQLQSKLNTALSDVTEATGVEGRLSDALAREEAHQQDKLKLSQQLSQLQAKLSSSEGEVAEVTALKSSLRELQEEQTRSTAQMNLLTQQLSDARRDMELMSAAAEAASLQVQQNGQQLSSEFIKHENESKALESAVQRLTSQLELTQRELDAQKTKNNDLRQKNWKAVDALSTAEKALESSSRQTHQLVDVACGEIRGVVEAAVPGLTLPADPWHATSSPPQWQAALTAAVNQLAVPAATPQSDDTQVQQLQKQVGELQTGLDTYKAVIEDTEGMLKKLQSHIEAEEVRWSDLLHQRQLQLDALTDTVAEREAVVSAQQQQLLDLTQLSTTQAHQLQTNLQEAERLRAQLTAAEERVKEINRELVKLRSNLKIGQDSYEAEHKIRLELEDKIKAISAGSTGDAAPIQNGTGN